METASLEQICTLIEEDWMDLRTSNASLKEQIQGLNNKISSMLEQTQAREKELLGFIQDHKAKIINL